MYITGTLTAPRSFIDKREIDPKKAVIVINEMLDKSEIHLHSDQDDNYCHEIIGRLELHPLFKELPINNDKTMSIDDFRIWVRKNKYLFASNDEHLALTSNLTGFKAKVDRTIADEKDTRGNSNDALQIAVTTDLKNDFTLMVPVIKSGEKEAIKVDICIMAQGNGVVIWLESNSVKQLLLDKVSISLKTEADYFTGKGFCVIYKA